MSGFLGVASHYPDEVVVGDFDGHGVPDLAVWCALDDRVSILLGTGAGGFSAPTTYS